MSQAADYAARCHAGDRRRGGVDEPYLNHLAEVARLLADATDGQDPALVAAGWLHDAVEDGHATADEIARGFGPDVAGLVAAATDPPGLEKRQARRRQVEEAPRLTDRAKALKVADKVSNLRARIRADAEDREVYRAWAVEVVAGCRGACPALDRLFDEVDRAARRA